MGLASRGINWDNIQGLYLVLGDDCVSDRLLERLRALPFLAVHAAYESAVTAAAHIVMPSTIWSERAGTYVAMDGRKLEARHATEPLQSQLGLALLFTLSDKLGHALTTN